MKMFKHLIFLLFILLGLTANAQNKQHDWGLGVNSAIYSYSALLENKLTNPYEYNIGANFVFSRYLSNNFDLTLQGNRARVKYPTNIAWGEPLKYNNINLYAANFTLKYKLDNGYIMREHSMFAPYLLVGGGAYLLNTSSQLNYNAPVGVGVDVHLGERTSLTFEAQYNQDLQSNISYVQHNMGLKIHIGPANKKRVTATKRREKERRYAEIQKYREKQRLVQAERAKNKLAEMKAEGLVAKIPTIEQDADLLLTNTAIALSPADEPRKFNVNIAPEKPKEALTEKQRKSTEIILPPSEPAIPVSPGRAAVEEPILALADMSPSIPKPNSVRNTPIEPAKPMMPENEPVITPVVQPEIVIETEEKPTFTTKVEEKPTPIKETENICKNSEVELSKIGEDINFDSDSYQIRSRMKADLAKILEILNACENNSYVIIAHTDSDGNVEYNKKLAAQRATAIKKYLMEKGIDDSRLITIAYGASLPIAPNTSAGNKAKNRRIEFKLNRTSFDQ